MAAGIYVHIPFCLRKCVYCDFFSRPVDNFELRREYTRALIYEIAFYGEKYGKNLKADTIFFGGGTPSLMEPKFIDSIIDALKKNFIISKQCEITMAVSYTHLTLRRLFRKDYAAFYRYRHQKIRLKRQKCLYFLSHISRIMP